MAVDWFIQYARRVLDPAVTELNMTQLLPVMAHNAERRREHEQIMPV